MDDELDGKMLYGNLETLALAALRGEPLHGYGIRHKLLELSGSAFQISYGRLYPLLRSLERRHMISGKRTRVGERRERRVYSLSARGAKELDVRISKWRRFASAVDACLRLDGREGA